MEARTKWDIGFEVVMLLFVVLMVSLAIYGVWKEKSENSLNNTDNISEELIDACRTNQTIESVSEDEGKRFLSGHLGTDPDRSRP